MTPNHWLILGFVGQALFGARFIIQWIVSERKGESTIPMAFWYCSISGAMVLLTYAVYKQDPVFIVGQSLGSVVYIRNLILIDRKRKSMEAVGVENE
ncbi:MAG: lipid A biosynthesis protein [Nitrospinae bacterium]|nr:lipid A biosynthesis protein [Nitrospinota bacterium]MZH40352.1 lipid A biosynthesis protein [Nitrospinota bacterium]